MGLVNPTFSCFQDEGDAFPPRIVDPKSEGRKRRANGAFRNRVVIQITWLAISRDVLAEENVLPFDGWDGSENLHLN